jgi:hypothetical protein
MAQQATSIAGRTATACFRMVQGPLAHAIRFLAAAIAYGLVILHPALAEDIIHLTGSNMSGDVSLVLLCPEDGSARPEFENRRTGATFPITDPRLRAIAEKACQPALFGSQGRGDVNIVNQTGKTIYVGFTPQAGSSITWGSGCLSPIKGLTVKILANTTCEASATDSIANPGSRFCAALSVSPTGLDCSMAQQNHQTIIEPYFEPAPCFGAGTSNCIWYDISVIPTYCTDNTPYGSKNSDWQSDSCAYTGGASYNIPVTLACTGSVPEPTFTCKGPPFTNGAYAAAGYPSKCGNPAGMCIDGAEQMCTNGVEAYFYPMSVINSNHQPVGVCPGGQTLTITFLAGP